MVVCPKCGTENPTHAKFCLECATPLGDRSRAVGSRKLVTILFADVVGSTALGEQLDPEALRGLLERYFELARTTVERHGGTIEKFIGDAVMAVFGIPVVHEDDALRATRAALDLRDAIGTLNSEIERSRRLRIEFRIGVNTGEVMAGSGDSGSTLVTGDAVNVAARLEQAAPAGEVLIGDLTHRLVRDFVLSEPTAAVSAKGKSEPVAAHRVIAIRDGGARPADGHALVGRDRELSRLRQALEDVRYERRCHLFTLLGSAGVGKSRLVSEFMASASIGTSVVRGRCLSYGEGITYWPIGEMVRGACDITESDDAAGARARVLASIGDAPDGGRIAELVSSAIGFGAVSAPRDELFWGIRRWLEIRAQEQALICLIEDIHWAEPTLLDLLEHIADWTRDAPILLLATARPELLETRTTWGGGKVNATTLLLAPLTGDATEALVAALVSTLAEADRLSPAVLRKIVTAAEGNPLFAEEIVRMLLDDKAAGTSAASDLEAVSIPTSVHAVISARLDRLPSSERTVAERAAVAGRIFERGAVVALVSDDERSNVGATLQSLIRKELVHPERPELTTDDAYRFRHVLIRDAAYDALPKAERAELHARFATWVESVAGDRLAELGEIVGYHYEQAVRYRRELGIEDEATAELANLAGDRLMSAAVRASHRGDAPAVTTLARRAREFLPTGRLRREAYFLDIWSLLETRRFDGVPALTRQMRAEAEADDDEEDALKAQLLDWTARMWHDPSAEIDKAEQLVNKAIPLFTASANRRGLSLAYASQSDISLTLAKWADAMKASQRGVEVSRGVDPVMERVHRHQVVNAAMWGPTPTPEFLEIVERELQDVHGERPRAVLLADRALGRALAGDAEGARRDIAESTAILAQAFGADDAWPFSAGDVEYINGDLHKAQEAWRETVNALRRKGETGARSTLLGYLALVSFDLGESDESINAILAEARETTAADDVTSQFLWRAVAALVAGRAGRFDEAAPLMAEAEAWINKSDFLVARALGARTRGRIAEMSGDTAAAREAYRSALELYQAKGDIPDAQRTRDALERLA